MDAFFTLLECLPSGPFFCTFIPPTPPLVWKRLRFRTTKGRSQTFRTVEGHRKADALGLSNINPRAHTLPGALHRRLTLHFRLVSPSVSNSKWMVSRKYNGHLHSEAEHPFVSIGSLQNNTFPFMSESNVQRPCCLFYVAKAKNLLPQTEEAGCQKQQMTRVRKGHLSTK